MIDLFQGDEDMKKTDRGKGVQRNRFEADEIVSTRHGFWDCRCPRRVLGDHLPVAPVPVIDCPRKQTGFVYLELNPIRD